MSDRKFIAIYVGVIVGVLLLGGLVHPYAVIGFRILGHGLR